MTKQDAECSQMHEPVEFSIVRHFSLSPAIMTLAATFIFLLVLWGAYYASGIALVVINPADSGWSLTPQAHASLLASALLGYGTGATKFIQESGAAWRSLDVARSRWGGIIGLVIGLVVSTLAIMDIRALEPERPMLNLGEAVLNIAFLALFWSVGRAAYFAVMSVMKPISITSVDLFDLNEIYAYGHDQLRRAMVWLTGASLFIVVMLFDPNPAIQVDSIKVIGPILACFVALSTVMALLPLRRIWLSIRKEKAGALASIMTQLRELRAVSNVLPGRESDLLARHKFISTQSEWPFDANSLGTFAFYIVLPFLTWFMGAIAKKLFETIFVEKLIKNISVIVLG